MTKMRKAYADGPYGQIHFLDACEGRPVVLLHQAIMSAHEFDNVYGPLAARGYRPIGIDMPGFGNSDAPPAPPAVPDYAKVVPAVLDALGIKVAAVGGHHTGALVTTEAANLYPDRVAAAILGGPFLPTDSERQALIDDIVAREKALTAQPEGAHMAEVARARERWARGAIGPDRMTDYVVQAMQAYRMGTYWYGHSAAFAYHQEQPLMQLRQPTLVLTNSGDMIHQHALKAMEMRPDFSIHIIEGGGIDICDEAPEEYANAMADFLDRVWPAA